MLGKKKGKSGDETTQLEIREAGFNPTIKLKNNLFISHFSRTDRLAAILCIFIYVYMFCVQVCMHMYVWRLMSALLRQYFSVHVILTDSPRY